MFAIRIYHVLKKKKQSRNKLSFFRSTQLLLYLFFPHGIINPTLSLSAEIKGFSVQIMAEAHLVLETLEHAPVLDPELAKARDAHQEAREQAHLCGVTLCDLGLQGLDQKLL